MWERKNGKKDEIVVYEQGEKKQPKIFARTCTNK